MYNKQVSQQYFLVKNADLLMAGLEGGSFMEVVNQHNSYPTKHNRSGVMFSIKIVSSKIMCFFKFNEG